MPFTAGSSALCSTIRCFRFTTKFKFFSGGGKLKAMKYDIEDKHEAMRTLADFQREGLLPHEEVILNVRVIVALSQRTHAPSAELLQARIDHLSR